MKLKETIDFGNNILCDMCNDDYTNSEETGGFLFGRKAVCPKCAPEMAKKIAKFNEQDHITEECPPHMSFKEFILNCRNGDNTIKIYETDK